MKASTPIEKLHGRYLPWAVGSAAFIGFAGMLFALSEVLENDSDGDGWTDAEEIIAGTNPADATDPWDSDGDGIADYLEFLDGTDPLDPNDPPQIRKSVLAYNVAVAGDEAENIPLPSLKSGAQQNIYHNTAWFGKRLNYTFFRPTADSKWQAINGNEIEYWSTGYYDLLARNGSSGIAITVENVPAGKYTLKWKHMQRPDGGSPGYTVSVSGASTASKRFTAPKTNSEGEIHEASLTFDVSERGTLVLAFDAGSSGTSGPLVGSIALREAITVSEVNLNAGDGGTEFAVTQDSGAAFTGSDWVLSRARQANPVAFQSGSALKIVPTFRLPDSTVPARIQAQVTLGNSTNTYTLAWSERGNGIEIPAPVPAGTVGYFENATIVWKVSYDANSDTWEDVGTSTHEIYFTRGAPLTPLRQETLFRISCKQAAGLTDLAAIVDAIYAEFTDRNVCRVSDGKQMTYWKDYIAGATTTSRLLRNESANGNCQAWSGLFRDTICLQGISAQRIKVFSKRIVSLGAGEEQEESVLVKNWIFGNVISKVLKSCRIEGDENSSSVEYTHIADFEGEEVLDGIAIPENILPGQGNSNTPPEFNGHWITCVESYYYDPSYGTEKVSISTPEGYENNAFSGFYTADGATYLCRINSEECDVSYTLDTTTD